MADILKWNKAHKSYLEKAVHIDVKNNYVEVGTIRKKMENALSQHPELTYVTANQVGFGYQMFTVRSGDKFYTYANPVMISSGKVIMSEETEYGVDCEMMVPRWSNLKFLAYDVNSKKVGERDLEGGMACLMQHIMNNLDGVSIEAFGLPITEEFKQAGDSEKSEVIAEYVKELNDLEKAIDDDLHSDPETGKMVDALDFMRLRAEGKIEQEEAPVKQNRKERRKLAKLFGWLKKKKK